MAADVRPREKRFESINWSDWGAMGAWFLWGSPILLLSLAFSMKWCHKPTQQAALGYDTTAADFQGQDHPCDVTVNIFFKRLLVLALWRFTQGSHEAFEPWKCSGNMVLALNLRRSVGVIAFSSLEFHILLFRGSSAALPCVQPFPIACAALHWHWSSPDLRWSVDAFPESF